VAALKLFWEILLQNPLALDFSRVGRAFDKTAEVFMATWKARWLGFKSTFGGDHEEREHGAVRRKGELYQEMFPRRILPEREMPPAEFGKPGGEMRPLWRRLFDLSKSENGIVPAAFRPEGGVNPLLGGGAGLGVSSGERMLEGAVERGSRKGIYDGL
jgi:hypothetical protein